ncbi:MAG: protein kinase [Cyanobacteria bacterium SZAS LIN-5]|nr:protein kinase [Cyanobacteria bacterium SZAS LIN-5]
MVTWVGSQVGDYLIDMQLGEGNFSWVYRGIHEDSGHYSAFKVAKPTGTAFSEGQAIAAMPTKAVATITGGIMEVTPRASMLIQKQHEQLAQHHLPGLIQVKDFVDKPELTYLEMEYISGPTLRDLMEKGPVSIDKMIEVARCLDKLSKTRKFAYHGDLKPENIMFSQSGAVVIDPGFFGKLELENGSTMSQCAVTTPAYYPMLEPDDVLAFGLLLWEVVMGEQPLNKNTSSDASDLTRVGPQLLELVQLQEAVGRYLLSPILDIQRPSIRYPNIDRNVENLLLKGLRLHHLGQGIEVDPGFRSFAAISGALATLRLKGKEQFLDQ